MPCAESFVAGILPVHGRGSTYVEPNNRERERMRSLDHAVVAGLRARGAELVGELQRYEDRYRLCYVRGPEGIIVELAEQIG
jgi:hypothetical protein